MDFKTSYQFNDENKIVEQKFTIPSSMRPGRPGSIFTASDSELYYIQIDIDVAQDDGIFSVIAMTDFSDLNVFLELSNDEHRIIAIEKSNMLDNVNNNNDPSLNNDESSVTAK